MGEGSSRGESGVAAYRPDEAYARDLDGADELAAFRERFHLPRRPDGSPNVYFCGNSLGLQPVGTQAAIRQELDAWARQGVDAHFAGAHPWYSYHERFRDSGARLVGALPDEVVMMNGLTVNLHLMLVSFYRPDAERYRILMEDAAFPSDTYAVKSQLRYHGWHGSSHRRGFQSGQEHGQSQGCGDQFPRASCFHGFFQEKEVPVFRR